MDKLTKADRKKIVEQQRQFLIENTKQSGKYYHNGQEFLQCVRGFVRDLIGQKHNTKDYVEAIKLFFAYDERSDDLFYTRTVRRIQDYLLPRTKGQYTYGYKDVRFILETFLKAKYNSAFGINAPADAQPWEDGAYCLRSIQELLKSMRMQGISIDQLVAIPDIYGGQERLNLQIACLGIPFRLEFLSFKIGLKGQEYNQGFIQDYFGQRMVSEYELDQHFNDEKEPKPALTITVSDFCTKQELQTMIENIPSKVFDQISNGSIGHQDIIKDFGAKLYAKKCRDNEIGSEKIQKRLKELYGINLDIGDFNFEYSSKIRDFIYSRS